MSKTRGESDDRNVPPVFSPMGQRKRGASSQTHGTASSTPPVFSPGTAKQRTGRSSASDLRHGAQSGTGEPPASVPPPHRSRSSSPTSVRPARSARTTSGVRTSHVSSRTSAPMPSGQPQRTTLPKRNPLPSTGSTKTKSRRSPGKTVFSVLLVLAVIVLIFLIGSYSWVNSKLDKADWLTDMANTDGTSWLILGSDQRSEDGIGGSAEDVPGFRTDTVLVLTKPQHGPSSLVSIPRDSLVKNGDDYMKINSVAEQLGKKNLVGQVENVTGQKIDHVALIKFDGLKDVVDAIGGVELCYDQTVNDVYSQLNWQAGCHAADGTTALAFSRMRYSDPNGDFGRAQRQREVISAIMRKGLSKETLMNPSRVQKLASTALSAIEVDNKTSPFTLISMVSAFKSASGKDGISGSVYWTDPGYYVDGVGSSVLLDDARNHTLFEQLADGTHKAGTVGTLAEAVKQ